MDEIPLVVTPSPVGIKQMGITRGTIDSDRTSSHLSFWRNETKGGLLGGEGEEREGRVSCMGSCVLVIIHHQEPPTIITDLLG